MLSGIEDRELQIFSQLADEIIIRDYIQYAKDLHFDRKIRVRLRGLSFFFFFFNTSTSTTRIGVVGEEGVKTKRINNSLVSMILLHWIDSYLQ